MRYPIAHGGNTTSDLCGAAHSSGRCFDSFWIIFIGLVGRQHVVMCRHNANISRVHELDNGLVVTGAGGHPVGEVAATELLAIRCAQTHRVNVTQVVVTQVFAALFNRAGDAQNIGVHSL